MRELRSVKRAEALAEVERQIANGSLHVRQMSADDRVRYPAGPIRAPKTRRRR
jgi:hypothetical protein